MRAGHQKCKETNTMATVTNSISQKKSGFFIWVLFIIHLSFSCPCPILTSHLLLNNLDGLWKSWVQWSSCPGSNGNLSFECLWTSVMLKMVNLKPPNRKCTLCINRRCYTKGLVKIKIKTVKVTWCRAKVKAHLWHPRTMLSSLIPILHNSPSLFNSRRLDNWVSQICTDCVRVLRIIRVLCSNPLWLRLK